MPAGRPAAIVLRHMLYGEEGNTFVPGFVICYLLGELWIGIVQVMLFSPRQRC